MAIDIGDRGRPSGHSNFSPSGFLKQSWSSINFTASHSSSPIKETDEYTIADNALQNIYNGIIFPSLNHAKIFDSIPDEHSHKVVSQLAKSYAEWFTSNKVKGVRK